MHKFLSTYLPIIFLTSISLSFTNEKKQLIGHWEIESVIVENDTLYYSGSLKHTVDFYNKQMGNWKKTDDDIKYIGKSIQSIFYNLADVKLDFNRKNCSHTKFQRVWDHIGFKAINNGNYTIEKDKARALEKDKAKLMELKHDANSNRLTYSNTEIDYQIIYKHQMT